MNCLTVFKCSEFGIMSGYGMNIFDKCLLNKLAFSLSDMVKEPSGSVKGGNYYFILCRFSVIFQRKPFTEFRDWYLFKINYLIVFARWLTRFLSNGFRYCYHLEHVVFQKSDL